MNLSLVPRPDEHTIFLTLEGNVDRYEYDPLSEPLPGATHPLPGKSLRSRQDVIIKYAETEKEYRLFHKECAAYHKIQQAGGHKNILAPLEIMLAAERISSYLILPLLPGEDLADLVEPDNPLPIGESVLIVEQISSALDFLHQIGIVHRDVSLCNIRIKEKETSAVLYDFNNSSLLNGVPLSTKEENVGSPEYTAPEIWGSDHFDHRADLYALGVTVYAMLTGNFPYITKEEKTLPLVEDLRRQHLHNPIPSAHAYNSALPPSIDIFFKKALAKISEERFQTAREFNAEFQKLVSKSQKYFQ